MNVLMAGLSAQLLIYSLTWLAMGLGYKLERRVALRWSAAWALGAIATGLLFLHSLALPVPRDLVVNACAIGAFFLVRSGVNAFVHLRAPLWEYALVVAGLALVEVLRLRGEAIALRVCIFTVLACWPLLGTAWRITHWHAGQIRRSRFGLALLLAPIAITVGAFTLRALLVVLGTDAQSVSYEQDNQHDLIASLVFLLVLGAFNFSLASLVVGALVERLRTLSATDQLTGLANRRVMMRRLVEEHARFLRSGHLYSVVAMDLDHFKRINDQYGHGVGDQVLKGLADLLQAGQRQTDTLARMGGEEFLLLMPMTDVDGALSHATRLCEKVATATLQTDAGPLQITLSLGVSEARLDDATADVVVNRADGALYKAKEHGRNRVEFAARVVMPGWVL